MGCVASFFQYGSYDLKEASEQESGEVEGTRRDIPEREYEREEQKLQVEPTIDEKEERQKPPAHPVETKGEVEVVDSEKTITQQETVLESKVESIDISLKEQVAVPLVQQSEESSKPVTTEVTDIAVHEKLQDENDNANVEGAVVKIQAGIRGYLTRKTLKEQRDSESARKSPLPEEKVVKEEEKQVVKETEVHALEASEPAKDEQPDEEKAAVKIQAVYRGYRTRKTLNENGVEVEEEREQGDICTDDQKSSEERIDSTESKIVSDESLVSVEEVTEDQSENEETTLQQAAVKIQSTFRGYQVRKQLQDTPIKENRVSDSSPSDKKEESLVTLSVENGENNSEDKAAVKIQAVYRGYKVRKDIQLGGTNAESEGEEKLSKTDSGITEEEEEEEEEESEEEEEEEEEEDEEVEEQVEEGEEEEVVLITLSPSAKHDTKESVKTSADSCIGQTIASAPLLDNNVKEHCDEKPSASESVEPKLSKPVSEPTVELNTTSKHEDGNLCSPSSD